MITEEESTSGFRGLDVDVVSGTPARDYIESIL